MPSERHVVPSSSPARAEARRSEQEPSLAPVPPLLVRLNRRGFRLLMPADALALSAIALGVMFYRHGTQWPTYSVPVYLVSFASAVIVFLGVLYFGGLYDREPRLGAPPVLPRVARQMLVGGGLVALLALASTGLARELGIATDGRLAFPIINLVVLMVVGSVAVAMNRRLSMLLRTRREGPPKVLLVGEESETETASRHLENDPEVAQVVGVTHEPGELEEMLERTAATDVVLLSGWWITELYPQRLQSLERRGVTVLLRVGAIETLYGLERIREVGGMPFVLVRGQKIPRSRAQAKRAFDLALLVLASPLAIVAVALTSLYQLAVAGRPLLYRQERVGVGGHTFEMLKFRTMIPDAEADGGGARLAETDDPRVIPACRWIRATRLDELPQLWNVVRGEMSLVGPRPERPQLTALFERGIVGYSRRHELPPGLTGLAQIHGRYHTDAEYKLGYDLQYLVNWSPVLDLEIIVRTIWVVLRRRV